NSISCALLRPFSTALFSPAKTTSWPKAKAPIVRDGWNVLRSPQLLMKKFACPPIGERCRRGIIVCAVMPREGMVLTRIAVDCRVWFLSKCRFDLSLRGLGNEL